MRRFLVQQWGVTEPFTVVWCKGVKCTDCRLRFDCWTRKEDFVITKHRENLGRYKFNSEWLPMFIEGFHLCDDGKVSHLGMRLETIIEWLIAGEQAQNVPSGQWSQGWVYQAGCQCPKATARQVVDSNFNKELKAVLFPCKECKESFICRATNRYRR